MYADGYGAPKNYAEACKWYLKAAEQGYARAQSNLGIMYADGAGVPRDYVQAYMWVNLAAAQGYTPAKDRLSELEAKMTREQIAKAQELSRTRQPAE
jgi:TPR repeat protein